jgi:protocatechuate 3,4-dioxygenase alpha subunit
MSADPSRTIASPSQTIGPFFHFAMGTDAALGRLAAPHTPGDHLRLRIRVLDGDGLPLSDALVELSQADARGRQPAPPETGVAASEAGFVGFGRLGTGMDGACVFETIRPGRIADHHGGWQAPHIAVCLFARGLLRHLYTRIYFAGDPALGEDAVLALVPQERRDSLLAHPQPDSPGLWAFDIHLQGDRETVFFDL